MKKIVGNIPDSGWPGALPRTDQDPWRLVLFAVVALGIVLRCFHVQSYELQYDEAATGYFAALPWADLWGRPAMLEPNPPLFYSLAWLVTRAGGSVEHIRYVSLAAGVLCIPLAGAIARHIAGEFAAGAAALLVAASPQHIAISQYARAYALLSLCLMVAFYCLLKTRMPLARRSQELRWWAAYVVAAAAALYTHHTAVVVLFALNVAVALTITGSACGHFFQQLIEANLLIAALYVPWLPVLIAQAFPSGAVSPTKAASATPVLQRLWNAILSPFPFKDLPWIDAWFLPVILFGAWRLRLSKNMVFLAAFVFGGVITMILASQVHPLLDGKTLAWAGVFAVVAAAIGSSVAGRFRLPVLVFLLLLELRSIPAALDPAPEGWREVAGLLRQSVRPQDTIYVNYAGAILPLRHYGWLEDRLTIKVFANKDEEPWFRGRHWQIVSPREAARQAGQAKRVWLLAYGETSEAGRIAKEMEVTSLRLLHWRTQKLDLSLFEPASP